MRGIIRAFLRGYKQAALKRHCHAEKNMRKRMKEYQIDEMIDHSFPASDPPSTY